MYLYGRSHEGDIWCIDPPPRFFNHFLHSPSLKYTKNASVYLTSIKIFIIDPITSWKTHRFHKEVRCGMRRQRCFSYDVSYNLLNGHKHFSKCHNIFEYKST